MKKLSINVMQKKNKAKSVNKFTCMSLSKTICCSLLPIEIEIHLRLINTLK